MFHRAIVESGSAFMPPVPPLATVEKAGETFAQRLKAPPGAAALVYLRGLSIAELLAAVAKQDPDAPPMLGPVVDGFVLSESPAEVFAAGKQTPIPLLIGSTSREFGFEGPPHTLRKAIEQFAGDLAPRALETYGLAHGGAGTTDPLYGSAGNQWLAD
jgi:para-nitrobenzyl esterase